MRPVGIAYIEIGNHVVDEIVDIDVMREGGIRRAIRIATLDPLVGRFGLQPLAGQREHGAPGLGVAVGGRAVGVGVPILLLSSEIGGRERMIRPLDGIVEAPVDTVDIDVDEALVGGDIAHGKNGLTPKGIADKKRVIPRSAPLPAIIGVGPQDDGVEALGRIVTKEGVAKLRVAVDLPEEKTQRVFLRQPMAAKSPTLDPDSAIDLEAVLTIGIEQFDRAATLPGPSP